MAVLLDDIISEPTLNRFKEKLGENAPKIWQEHGIIPNDMGNWCLLLRRKLSESRFYVGSTGTITVLDVGAGTFFLPTFLTIKDIFPTLAIRYVCIDPDAEGAAIASSLRDAAEGLEYIVGSAINETLLQIHGLTKSSVDVVLSTYPVVRTPSAMAAVSVLGRESISRQQRDFRHFFAHTMPFLLRAEGLFFSIVFNGEDVLPLKSTILPMFRDKAVISSRANVVTTCAEPLPARKPNNGRPSPP